MYSKLLDVHACHLCAKIALVIPPITAWGLMYYHTQAEYCAISENRVFTLFLATGHQLARYNAFLFAK